MAKGDDLYARLEVGFIRSFEFQKYPMGTRLLYLSLWCYSLEKRRQLITRPSDDYLRSMAGLKRVDITMALQRLHDGNLLDVTETTIEVLGIMEKHKQFQWATTPKQKRTGRKQNQTPPKERNGTERNGTNINNKKKGRVAAADYLRSLKIEEAKIVSIFKTRKVEAIINAIELTVERKPDSPSGYFLSIVEKDDLPPSKAGKERRKKGAEASRVAAQETKYLKARTRELEEDRAAQAELEELEAAHASMGDEDLAGVEKVIDQALASLPGSFKQKRENLRLGAVKKYLESKEEP